MQHFRTQLSQTESALYAALIGEENRQREGIELIPSENYTYPEVLALLGSVFTNKYSEGYPGRRYYAGQTYTDQIETLARDRACTLFRAEHANVQPLSGLADIGTVASFGLDGKRAEAVLDRVGIATNKQVIPDDPRPSGIRLGTPACTTRGMKEREMELVAHSMVEALRRASDEQLLAATAKQVRELCLGFPVPGVAAA